MHLISGTVRGGDAKHVSMTHSALPGSKNGTSDHIHMTDISATLTETYHGLLFKAVITAPFSNFNLKKKLALN